MMLDSLRTQLGTLPDIAIWFVPVVGGLVCGLALLVGRRVFFKPHAPKLRDHDLMPGSVVYEGVSRDRRSTPRRRGNSVEVQMNLDDDKPLLRGWVLDRSIGGLCLMGEEAIAEGTVIRLRPRSAAETVPWTEVTIRSCREDGGRYELGCQFHRTPNWNLLLQFG